MPTILTHAAVPLALGLGLGARRIPARLLVAGVVASMLPDLDVLAFRFHVAYGDAFGHRGASHSLAFALMVGLMAMALASHLKTSPRIAFAFVAVLLHPMVCSIRSPTVALAQRCGGRCRTCGCFHLGK